jgi:hypothetical protein
MPLALYNHTRNFSAAWCSSQCGASAFQALPPAPRLARLQRFSEMLTPSPKTLGSGEALAYSSLGE